MNLYIFDSHERCSYQYYTCIVIAENLDEAIKIIEDECEKNRQYKKEHHDYRFPDDLVPMKLNDPRILALGEYGEFYKSVIVPRLIYSLDSGYNESYQKGFIYANGHDG